MTKLETLCQDMLDTLHRTTRLGRVGIDSLRPNLDEIIAAAKEEERQACLDICEEHVQQTEKAAAGLTLPQDNIALCMFKATAALAKHIQSHIKARGDANG